MSEIIPTPTIPWKKALRIVFGGRTEEHRTRLFRQLYRSLLSPNQSDKSAETIEFYRTWGVSAIALSQLQVSFRDWKKRRDVEQRRAAANSRWHQVLKKTIDTQTRRKK